MVDSADVQALSCDELDAAVHREVWKRSWDKSRCPVCGSSLSGAVELGCVEGNCSMRPSPERRADAIPRYSSDIGQAFSVQESLHHRGFWMRLQSPFEGGTEEWHCGFTHHSFTGWNGRPEYAGEGGTAAIAICRAALVCVRSAG
jgi:hypothetical protein